MNYSDKYQAEFRSWAFNAFLNTSWVDNPTLEWFGKCIADALKKPDKGKTFQQPYIFGLCGNAGTGKDSAIEYIKYCPYIKPVYKLALADPIREIGKIFGFSSKQMADRGLKETVDPYWGFSPRTFMQKVGTEMFRNCLREDIWIKLLEKRINDLKNGRDFSKEPVQTIAPLSMIFITDVRFPNEAEAIKKLGGYIIKIRREGFSKSDENLHPSEKFIESMPADYVIENKYPDAQTWSWEFAHWLAIFLKTDAFFEINEKHE